MHQQPESKQTNKERKKILRQLKREKRAAKKATKVTFKANEAMQKQTMYALKQNLSSLQF